MHKITSITVATHEASRLNEHVAFLRDNPSEPCHSYFMPATSDSFWRALRALRVLAMRKHQATAQPDAPWRDKTVLVSAPWTREDLDWITPNDTQGMTFPIRLDLGNGRVGHINQDGDGVYWDVWDNMHHLDGGRVDDEDVDYARGLVEDWRDA